MKKLALLFLMILLITLTACFEETSNNDEFLTNITKNNVVSSNIGLVIETITISETTEESSSVTDKSRSDVTSGVIIKKEGNLYYALTAHHIVKDMDDSKSLYVLLHDEDPYQIPREMPIDSYFTRKANIVKSNEEYDLALISFNCDEDLNVVKISEDSFKKGISVSAIGNPTNKGRNYISFGTIKSKALYEYESDGMITKNCFNHSAYISYGSSGSMLINDKLELVGINLGGSLNIFKNFKHGTSVSAEGINNFLNE